MEEGGENDQRAFWEAQHKALCTSTSLQRTAGPKHTKLEPARAQLSGGEGGAGSVCAQYQKPRTRRRSPFISQETFFNPGMLPTKQKLCRGRGMGCGCSTVRGAKRWCWEQILHAVSPAAAVSSRGQQRDTLLCLLLNLALQKAAPKIHSRREKPWGRGVGVLSAPQSRPHCCQVLDPCLSGLYPQHCVGSEEAVQTLGKAQGRKGTKKL